MKKSKILGLLFLLGMSSLKLQAQQSPVASGGNAAGSGGSVSFSVGQIAYTTAFGSTGSVSQGVQQPYEIFTLGVDDFPNISLTMAVYPNPTTSWVNLKIENFTEENLEYQLYDLQGKLISNRKITQDVTQIDMSNLATAIYFLKIFNSNAPIKTFKIIKNN
jgi:hypothetical protein